MSDSVISISAPSIPIPSFKWQYKNRVLASLPAAEIKSLAAQLSPIVLPLKEPLADRHMPFGYFLEEGLASLVITDESGNTSEVGVIGIEGVVGVPILLGVDGGPGVTSMQVAGSGYRIAADHLKESFDRPGALRTHLQKYIQGFMVQSAQMSVCNRHHGIVQRLARWLLTCNDRIQLNRMPVTHELLGNMLGAPRVSVTLAARQLHRARLIEYRRGQVTITNRPQLEHAACGCYRVVRDEFRRLNLL